MNRLSILFAAPLCVLLLTAASVKDEVPFRADSGLTKAEYFLATQKYAQAIDEAQSVLKRHPKDGDALTYMGFAYHRLGDKEKAVEFFDRALAVSPRHLGANKYRADLYLESGNIPRAFEQLQVLRSVCGAADCEEINELERAINAAKSGSSKPAAKKETTAEPPKRGEVMRP